MDSEALLRRWVTRHGVEGDYLTELTMYFLNGGTIDGYHEEQRRANDMGHVLEDSGGHSGNTDVALLGNDVLLSRVNGK